MRPFAYRRADDVTGAVGMLAEAQEGMFLGVGELAIVGSAAAVANAAYYATGVRVRDLPITLDKLLEPPDPR